MKKTPPTDTNGSLGELPRILGDSPQVHSIHAFIEEAAPADPLPVLIVGRTGDGKELVARHIHDRSPRRHGPFLAINCAAVPPDLAWSEILGHEVGAFTGAAKNHPGVFERAHRGTLFLDELQELPLRVEPILLRLLEESVLTRIGGKDLIPFDVRVVSALNSDPVECVTEGRLRRDLYMRLKGFRIELPTLHQRGRDVLILARAFLEEAAQRTERSSRSLSAGAESRLLAYSWPGGVRELRNEMERAIYAGRNGEILPQELDLDDRGWGRLANEPPPSDDADRQRLETLRALEQSRGLRGKAALLLGIHRTTLQRRMKRLGITSAFNASGSA